MTDAERAVLTPALALFAALGKKPSIRSMAAVIEAAHGKKAMRWQTIAEALKTVAGQHLGQQSGTPEQQNDEGRATPGQQSTSATRSAHVAKGVVIDSGDLQDSNPHPQPPLLTADPVAEETAVALGGVDASPVPVIPPKLTISAQDPDTDFAPFAEDIAALIAVDRTRHPRKANWSEKWLRQSLALWRIKHGDDAFACGIEIGISSGNGCDYARGVMERFNPDRDLRAIDGGRYPYKPGHPLYDQNLDPDFDPDQGFEYTPEAEIHRSPQDIALLQRAGIAL